MQTNLRWTGREYHSMEDCLVNHTPDTIIITSTIIGYYESNIYKVEYCIKTNRNWETVFVEINSRVGDQSELIRLEGDGMGNWKSEGKERNEFNGCIDIDISLTPFTNSLPINRLNLQPNETHEIKVIYIDLLGQQTIPVRQRYGRISRFEYHYENVPNDFEAIIQVDESGFVVDYPPLFIRTRKEINDDKK